MILYSIFWLTGGGLVHIRKSAKFWYKLSRLNMKRKYLYPSRKWTDFPRSPLKYLVSIFRGIALRMRRDVLNFHNPNSIFDLGRCPKEDFWILSRISSNCIEDGENQVSEFRPPAEFEKDAAATEVGAYFPGENWSPHGKTSLCRMILPRKGRRNACGNSWSSWKIIGKNDAYTRAIHKW